jgi:hypothetical protein
MKDTRGDRRALRLGAAACLAWLCSNVAMDWLAARVVRAESQEPPQVLVLPEVALPESTRAAAHGVLEVVAVIGSDGRAELESVDATAEVTEAIRRALGAATFKPALRDGRPVAARVRLRLRVAPIPRASDAASVVSSSTGSSAGAAGAQPSAAATTAGPEAPSTASPSTPEDPQSSEARAYGARARVKPVPVTAKRLELEEMRELPGAFGDPFRVLDTLPGVVPVLSGVPYVYVRGAPPASTIYVYDDITIPALFHLALLNAVIHPAMLGDLEFYPSVAPARYGRKTGGVFGAQGPKPQVGFQGEIELRLIDAALMLSIPFGDEARVTVAGRYGYPGPLVNLIEPEARLAYWDYQVRLDLPLGGPDKFVLTWFGSYDLAGSEDSLVHMTFHRAELRLLRDRPRLQLGAALQLGYDRAGSSSDLKIEGLRFGPRLWVAWEADRTLHFRVGADMLATSGRITILEDEDDVVPVVPPQVDPMGMPATPREPFANGMNVQPPAVEASENDFLVDGSSDGSRDARRRNMIGAYAEMNWRPSKPFELSLGVRGDLWITGADHAEAAEPRTVATWHLDDQNALHIGAGISFQPAVFPVPIPGLSDIVLDRGLQRAIQSELGYRLELPDELRFETTIFYNHMTNLLFLDTLFDCESTFGPSCDVDAFPRATADAYGWEVFLQRPSQHPLSGWLSYTLGRGVARGPSGRDFTPAFDVRHVANLVLQYDLGSGFRAGILLLYRSGRMASRTTLDVTSGTVTPDGMTATPPFSRIERRLPGFFRADALIAYRWDTHWGRMRLALEWMNLTFSREAFDLKDCYDLPEELSAECGFEYTPAIVVANLGLRAEF